MECFKTEKLSFSYPNREDVTLNDISITISNGEFVTVCGESGCGKTTLLRLLKTQLSPHGVKSGNIYFMGKSLEEYSVKEQAAKIGFVLQTPDNQIVTDKVWHELAFGPEGLGLSNTEIRTRVSEMAAFFGIENWFYKKTNELSGGQKQILNLASIMVMQPSVVILDEPTSQLDPIAAQEFLSVLRKINRELGTTVIIAEHRLEEAFSMSDRVIVIDGGRVIVDDVPRKVGNLLCEQNHKMYKALPVPMRVVGEFEKSDNAPMTIREGRMWLENYAENHTLKEIEAASEQIEDDTVIEIREVWFKYEQDLPDVIKGLSLKINKGELFAVVGGNGTGKTTALSLIAGLNTPYRGKILINGADIKKEKKLLYGELGVLPQNPQSIFMRNTVYLDLIDMLSESELVKSEKDRVVREIAERCHIENLLDSHPYDLSGGEQQRAALAKVLLKKPNILLLDEPTKGMDVHFKDEFAEILRDLKNDGITIVVVSHDIEFCAENADRCAMFFDGAVTSIAPAREFFAGNEFYTTQANRMARTVLPKAVLADDIISACGKDVVKRKTVSRREVSVEVSKGEETVKVDKTPVGIFKLLAGLGALFALIVTVTEMISGYDVLMLVQRSGLSDVGKQIASIIETAILFLCILPGGWYKKNNIHTAKSGSKLSKRTTAAVALIFISIPFTIYLGTHFFGGRKYYFISLLIILQTIIPFCMIFEGRKPQAREIVIISVICATAVAGRAAFFMLPQFKPVAAIVIIAAVCFGGETRFLVGAVTGFVSNFFFGQGPWTPWQMFSFGLIGFFAGVLFRKGFLSKKRLPLAVFGFVSTIVIYGGVMNTATVIMYQENIQLEMILSSYIMGLPFDMIHAVSTAFFLWFISEPMIEKIDRVKIKYGLIE